MTRFLGVRTMGALYRDGVPVLRPARPWLIDLSALCPAPGMEPGDIADFSSAPDPARWRLGDTPSDPDAALRWVAIEEADRLLLVCDRVILMRVSWDDLDAAGLVTGRPVRIDGAEWVCQLMSGGTGFADAEGLGGASEPNEWDGLVGAMTPPSGLPIPQGPDLDGVATEAARAGAHNGLWHWFGAHSWTRDPFLGRETARCCRGYRSARFFYLNTRSHRHEDIGWRPVLVAAR